MLFFNVTRHKPSSHVEFVSPKMPIFTTRTAPIYQSVKRKSSGAPARGIVAEAECAAVYIDVDYSGQFHIKMVTSKHLRAGQKKPAKRLKGKVSALRPLKVYADHSRFFQPLWELVNAPCVWMRPAVFVCVCLVGAERPQ